MPTGISYVDETWNPVIGCTKCSPGCLNCYAEKMAHRIAHIEEKTGRKSKYGKVISPGLRLSKNRHGEWNNEVFCDEKALDIPLHWRKPRRILVCSMGDLFHESVLFEFIDKVFAIMALCPQHTFLVLTKREKQMAEYIATRTAIDDSARFDRLPQYYHIITGWLDDGNKGYLGSKWDACEKAAEQTDFTQPIPNTHLGATICTQKEADEKIPLLLQIPAAHRWLSIEPILDFVHIPRCVFNPAIYGNKTVHFNGKEFEERSYIDWVVAGCESGPNRRPCKLEWIRSIVEQCEAAGVGCFVKQIEINGKVEHDMSKFPAWARVREPLCQQ